MKMTILDKVLKGLGLQTIKEQRTKLKINKSINSAISNLEEKNETICFQLEDTMEALVEAGAKSNENNEATNALQAVLQNYNDLEDTMESNNRAIHNLKKLQATLSTEVEVSEEEISKK